MIHYEPATQKEAISGKDSAKWSEAMDREMDSLKTNEVWDLTPLPANKKAIGSKWVYKVKTNSDGSVERYKARLVAKGFSQKFGSDYDETFCPVVRLESLRNLVSLSTKHSLKLHHIDICTAFLNGTLEEEVYMEQPVGFIKKGEEHLVCRLKKSIYGLKQAPDVGTLHWIHIYEQWVSLSQTMTPAYTYQERMTSLLSPSMLTT